MSNRDKAALVWVGTVIVVVVVGLWFMWAKWHTAYSVTIPLDKKFENAVHERFPEAKFTAIEKLEIDSKSVLETKSPDSFIRLLKGNERIYVLTNGSYSTVTKAYKALLDSGEWVVYQEVFKATPSGGGNSWSVTELTDERIVFHYDNSGDVGFATFFVIVVAFLVGLIGAALISGE